MLLRISSLYCILVLFFVFSSVFGFHVYSAGGGRDSSKDFNTLVGAGNNTPMGIWSDGTTMWVSDWDDNKLYAYTMSTKARDSSKDFNTLSGAGNRNPRGIWSDGTTMWVADSVDNRIYAYTMATKARDSSKDFTTLSAAGNTFSLGIWSDGTTMWVADYTDYKLYAYNLSTKARDSSKDFTTLSAAGNRNPRGIWSDGTTMWVADNQDYKLYAYNLSTKARDSSKDFTTLSAAGNTTPLGIWSDGTTMWVADWSDDKLYAYNGFCIAASVPSAPAVSSSNNSCTVSASDPDKSSHTYQYRKGTSGSWQSGGTFTGLANTTAYSFYARRKGNSPGYCSSYSSASSSVSCTPKVVKGSWRVASYIWNERLNLWGRTSCLLPVTIPTASGQTTVVNSETACRNNVAGSEKLSHVLYYHEVDPSGGTEYGKLIGSAWSSVFGAISFDVSGFPNTACYGLTGANRQARIKKSGNSVVLTGCAYSPLLKEYILFNKAGATGTPAGWDGVDVTVEEDSSANVCGTDRSKDVDCFVKVPYLKLHGCAWSSKNGYWAFGPNTGSFDGKDNCLPSGHQYTLDSSGVGNIADDPILINSSKSSVNIGQLVRYTFSCKSGYSSPVRIEILNDSGDVVRTILNPSSPYSHVALSSVARIRLVCADSRSIFPTVQKFDGGGVTTDSIIVSSFKVTPSVVTDGGFVTVDWEVSNRGAFGVNNARCSVVNALTGAVKKWFSVDSLSVSGSLETVVVRDTVFHLQCFYDVSSGGKVVKNETGVYETAVKVLPRASIERYVSGSVGLPAFQLSGDDITMSVPSGAYEVYVYALDSDEFVGESTLHTVAIDRSEARSGSGETDTQLKNRLFGDSLDSGVSTVFTSNNSVSFKKNAFSDKVLVAEARTFDGRWSGKAVYVPVPATGAACNNTVRNGCIVGTANDAAVADTGTYYRWRCDGTGGEVNSVICQIPKPNPVVGVCDETVRNGCSYGTYSVLTGDTSYYKWRCDGLNGGANSRTCKILKSSFVVGVCDETVRNGCSTGTANDAVEPDDTDTYKWRCDGSGGGGNSRTCSVLKSKVVVGSCNNTKRNGCSTGTANDVAVTDTSTHYRWRCDGIVGGANSVACRSAKPSTCTDGQTSPKLVTATGSFSFSVPCNITSLAVELVGAGGKGGNGGSSGGWAGGNGSAGGDTTFGTLTAKGGGGGGGGGYASNGGSGAGQGGGGGGGNGSGGSGSDGGGRGGNTASSGSSGTGAGGGGGGGGKGGTGGNGKGNGGAGSSGYNLGGGGGSGQASASGGNVNTSGGVANGASYAQSAGGDGFSGSKNVSGLSNYGKGKGGSSGPFSGQYAGGGGGGGGAYVKKNSYTVTPGQTISGSVGTAGGSGAQNGAARLTWAVPVINGSCDTLVQNSCTAGTFEDISDTGTHYQWRCKGLNGGTTDSSCSISKSSVIVGACDNTVRNGCSAGSADDAAEPDDTNNYKWRCAGGNGGIDSVTCSILKSSYSVGDCNNTIRNGCNGGTVNDAVEPDDTDTYKWRCDGSGGGANSGTCSIPKSSVVAGKCATLTAGTVPSSANACAAGVYNDGAVTDLYRYYKWRCDGTGGAPNSPNPPCQVEKHFDFATLVAAGNSAPRGLWSNGTTMWVVDSSDDKIYAYIMSTKARDSSKDFNTLSAAGNNNPYGLWSDGTTMWVSDISDKRLYAYKMSDKSRDSSKDFVLVSNNSPRGIWSDGTTMWVANYQQSIYAYTVSTKARDTSKEFSLASGNTRPRGLWSDSTTMWVVDYLGNKLYAYVMSTKARDSSKDITFSTGRNPHGVWSDSTKVWRSGVPAQLYAFDL